MTLKTQRVDRLKAMCQLGLNPLELRHLAHVESASRTRTNPGTDTLARAFGFHALSDLMDAIEECCDIDDAKWCEHSKHRDFRTPQSGGSLTKKPPVTA